MSAPRHAPDLTGGWWTKPALLIAVIVLAGAPLWWPAIPPLTDLLGHMGRYAVQLDGGHSADLARWYHFEWRWLGNLGVDLLVHLLGPVLGVEAATKLVVIAIPMLTAAGFLAVAREVHGRVPPTAFFALPLAYGYPFLWGFANFALAMALAFLAFALWLRLARAKQYGLRFLLFLPLSLLLWTAHIYGWAAFCVLAASAELARWEVFSRKVFRVIGMAVVRCLCLLPPIVLMLLQYRESGAGGEPWARVWFNFDLKWRWAQSVLRDRWEIFDKASLILILVVVLVALLRWAWVRRRPSGGPLILAALIFSALFVLLPHALLGSAYADMRLTPYAVATAVLAIGPAPRFGGILAVAALSFFGVRLSGTALSTYVYDKSYTAELDALNHVPRGARLISFVGRPCAPGWSVHRLDHLPSMALIRRHAFANDQWQASGAQLISVRYQQAGPFNSDPNQYVVKPRCARFERRAFPEAIASFPRDAFDYVWIIQQPDAVADMAGLEPIWQRGRSTLYRVVRTK